MIYEWSTVYGLAVQKPPLPSGGKSGSHGEAHHVNDFTNGETNRDSGPRMRRTWEAS